MVARGDMGNGKSRFEEAIFAQKMIIVAQQGTQSGHHRPQMLDSQIKNPRPTPKPATANAILDGTADAVMLVR